MVARQIKVVRDEILTKKCKPAKAVNDHIMELIEGMSETMYQINGCDLTASQVGVLKQIVTIDTDDGNQYVLINPEITAIDGSQAGHEGCLSLLDKSDIVTHSDYVKVKALNGNMEPCELGDEGLLTRVVYHKCAYLKG